MSKCEGGEAYTVRQGEKKREREDEKREKEREKGHREKEGSVKKKRETGKEKKTLKSHKQFPPKLSVGNFATIHK